MPQENSEDQMKDEEATPKQDDKTDIDQYT
jgi:hypothetical protein